MARDQLQYSVAELSTHDNQRVTTALNNGLQAALTGSKSPADAMRDSQREADAHAEGLQAVAARRAPTSPPQRQRVLRLADRVTAWLLLLPALALLAAFTHWPALATLWHSFMSTPKKGRPARFVGLDNYRGMVEDEVFWQALWNNLIFAVGTIPALDRAGDLDGALGQRPHRAAAASSAWPTSRRPCCR